MYQIIDDRCSGKTSRLFLLAKENDGIVVCANPQAMQDKALRYGIVGVSFMSYHDYFNKVLINDKKSNDKPIYIDEISMFWKYIDSNFDGYTETKEE